MPRSSLAALPEVPFYSISIALTYNFKSTYSNCCLWRLSYPPHNTWRTVTLLPLYGRVSTQKSGKHFMSCLSNRYYGHFSWSLVFTTSCLFSVVYAILLLTFPFLPLYHSLFDVSTLSLMPLHWFLQITQFKFCSNNLKDLQKKVNMKGNTGNRMLMLVQALLCLIN